MRSITQKFRKHIFPDRIAAFKRDHRAQGRDSNRLTFSQPGGHCDVHDPATPGSLREEVSSIKAGPMWRYWPPLLVVVDPTIDHEKFLGAALRGIRHDVVDLPHRGNPRA